MGPTSPISPRRPIGSIAEIPFAARDPLDLLNLSDDRDEPDPDYVGFGHCRVDEVVLEDGDGARIVVRDARIVALHSCDLGAARPDDIELEFFIDEVAPDYSVRALLSTFLAARLEGLRGDERAIVLAMCNPHRAALGQVASAGATPVYYAVGDVESWLDPDDGTEKPCLRLLAEAWMKAGEG